LPIGLPPHRRASVGDVLDQLVHDLLRHVTHGDRGQREGVVGRILGR
jgi:hypothetical protein